MNIISIPLNAACLPSLALRRFAWCVLAYFIAVILWGTLVRATGSGAGCGEHWPLCNGVVIQHTPRIDTIIELTHRITSGISFFSAIGLLAWTFAGTRRGHFARTAAIAVVLFTLFEAILGALLVKLGLTAQSQSPLRAPYLALHLANTLLLLAALALTAHFLSRSTGYLRANIHLVSPWSAIVSVFAVMLVGVTGSLAALGDTLFPATSIRSALAHDFSANSSWLLRWRWTHPVAATLAGAFILWITWKAVRSNPYWNNRGLASALLILLVAQFILGLLDIVLLAPVWLQIMHLLGADVLWTVFIVLIARLTLTPAQRA